MLRVAVIGAGSLSLGKRLIDEILLGLTDIEKELRLLSVHEDHVRLVAGYTRRTGSRTDCPPEIRISRDVREAVDGADAVITVFDIGGHRAAVLDHEIAMEYGIGQCIGDTLGPGAVMRAQRVIPVMDRLRRDMAELAPDCLLINYVNPLGPVGMALNRRGRHRQVGMCGGPAEMLTSLEGLLDETPLTFRLAGTNHMSWLISLQNQGGEDLYPRLKQRLLQPDIAGKERSRTEILQTFGYFCSESSGQLTDMQPWFRNCRESRDLYLGPGYAGETGIYPKVTGFLHRHFGRMNFLEHADPENIAPLEASLTRILRREAGLKEDGESLPIFGNVVNENARIKNLSPSAFVETTLSFENGMWIPEHEMCVPETVLPLSRRHSENSELITKAALSGDADDLVRAMCLDSITSAQIGISTIREMTYKYIEREREWLPQYRRVTPYSGVDFRKLDRVECTILDGESFVDRVRSRAKR